MKINDIIQETKDEQLDEIAPALGALGALGLSATRVAAPTAARQLLSKRGAAGVTKAVDKLVKSKSPKTKDSKFKKNPLKRASSVAGELADLLTPDPYLMDPSDFKDIVDQGVKLGRDLEH